jgi:hypothetical protein
VIPTIGLAWFCFVERVCAPAADYKVFSEPPCPPLAHYEHPVPGYDQDFPDSYKNPLVLFEHPAHSLRSKDRSLCRRVDSVSVDSLAVAHVPFGLFEQQERVEPWLWVVEGIWAQLRLLWILLWLWLAPEPFAPHKCPRTDYPGETGQAYGQQWHVSWQIAGLVLERNKTKDLIVLMIILIHCDR